jgi:alkylation response protein AidB-like acyl-CoA dehydrogenase
MSAMPKTSFLSEDELRERAEAFRSGPATIEHAADCGFFGLTVPPIFGGFGMPTEQQWLILNHLATSGPKIISQLSQEEIDRLLISMRLRIHWGVCSEVVQHGTYAQYDFFLPQLAAAKRIGMLTKYMGPQSLPVTAERTDNGFALHGDVLTMSVVTDETMIKIPAWLDGLRRTFLVSVSEMPAGAPAQHQMFYSLHDWSVPPSTLLGGEDQSPPDTEKWRAIRWNSVLSGS